MSSRDTAERDGISRRKVLLAGGFVARHLRPMSNIRRARHPVDFRWITSSRKSNVARNNFHKPIQSGSLVMAGAPMPQIVKE
ncbi:hypothetical protein IHQ71_02935 [Rhizobium sp. TH2]|uniref:hypothetical protein n=1 Tax=Rhizobium sp. TH2 TaxID=2775403 RepID=UPI0021575B1E|nr:hypothetical protein [Rhizobium sp. TH2]UVC09598.1 hypothetical protein IHQ71_02935 [Rhizobium sp. TH2]